MKFLSSSYNQYTGRSTSIVQHLGKKFVGEAFSAPTEITSKYSGCFYAEIRATIKALKYERTKVKEEFKICKNFVKSIECYAKFNAEDESAKSIYRQLNAKEKRIIKLTEGIDSLKEKLRMAIKTRSQILEKLKDKNERSKKVKS